MEEAGQNVLHTILHIRRLHIEIVTLGSFVDAMLIVGQHVGLGLRVRAQARRVLLAEGARRG